MCLTGSRRRPANLRRITPEVVELFATHVAVYARRSPDQVAALERNRDEKLACLSYKQRQIARVIAQSLLKLLG